MTTKDQERKALEKIRKIVSELGETSYIGMAFEGCFELAESNIEYDFGDSMKQRAESAERDAERISDLYKGVLKELETAKADAEKIDTDRDIKINKIVDLNEQLDTALKSATENWNKFREMEDRCEAQEQEIIKLKAKLDDLMTA